MRAALKEHKDIFKAIHRSQHCQRNWDLSQALPENDVEIILEAATQCPSKQNLPFYKVHAIQDRATIEQIHELTQGFGFGGEVTTNSQVLANLVLLFEANTPTMLKTRIRTNLKGINPEFTVRDVEETLKRDQHMAAGVAAGYVNMTAGLLGYGTGCCACLDHNGVADLLELNGEPMLIMGVGMPGSKSRRIHHTDENFKFPTLKKQPIEVIHR